MKRPVWRRAAFEKKAAGYIPASLRYGRLLPKRARDVLLLSSPVRRLLKGCGAGEKFQKKKLHFM